MRPAVRPVTTTKVLQPVNADIVYRHTWRGPKPTAAVRVVAMGKPPGPGVMPAPRRTQEDFLKEADATTIGYIVKTGDKFGKNWEDLTFAEFEDYVNRFLAIGLSKNYEMLLIDAKGTERINTQGFMERLFYENRDALINAYNQAVAVYTGAPAVMQIYTTDDLEYFKGLLRDYIKMIAEHNNVNLEDVSLADFHNLLRIAPNGQYISFSDAVADHYNLNVHALERLLFEQAKYELTH